MNRRASLLISGALLVLVVSGVAQEEAPDPPPTWQDVIAGGLLPYRQLAIAAFPINDIVAQGSGCEGAQARAHLQKWAVSADRCEAAGAKMLGGIAQTLERQ